MLKSCYSHDVPVLRPYGQRNAHLGTTSTGLPSAANDIFDFTNCKVATYIIKKYESESLKNRNGSPTELAIHAKDCDECKISIREKTIEPTNHKYKTKILECDADIIQKLEWWIKKNAPSQRHDQAILLLIQYFEFARKELKGRL